VAAEANGDRETRRPRHTKPRKSSSDGECVKLIVSGGRAQGIEPADVIEAIVDNSHLEGEDIRNVRVLERFSFVEVPAQRADEVIDKVSGSAVRGNKLRLEVAKR
jgi:ATP-dependent RNA helicase DeaD